MNIIDESVMSRREILDRNLVDMGVGHATTHRVINSSPIINRHEDYDSDEESGVLDQMEKKMRARNDRLYKPMSSPIRGSRSTKGGFHSRSLGAKYTLRTRQYIPFNEQVRNEKRAQKAIENRGGSDEMERFIQTQGVKEGIAKLNEEANTHMFTIDELSEEERPNKQPKDDAYEKELEEMIRMEQEELEMLTANLNLDS